MFRIICPATKTAVFSRTHIYPEVWNYTASSARKWRSCALNTAIVKATSNVLATQTLTNNTNHDQEMSFSLNETEAHTSTWEYSTGFTNSVSTSLNGASSVLPLSPEIKPSLWRV